MPKTTLPMPRKLPDAMQSAIASFVGPIPRYAPGQRAPETALGPVYRGGGNRLARVEQINRMLRNA